MKFINSGVQANAYDAPRVAREMGGRQANHAQVDFFKMKKVEELAIQGYKGNSGTYWAGWVLKNVPIVKNKDIKDEFTRAFIAYSDISKQINNINNEMPALSILREMRLINKIMSAFNKREIFGASGLLFTVEPEAFTQRNGLYVMENPKITLVRGAVLKNNKFGFADSETKFPVNISYGLIESLPPELKKMAYEYIEYAHSNKDNPIFTPYFDRYMRHHPLTRNTRIPDGIRAVTRQDEFLYDYLDMGPTYKHDIIDTYPFDKHNVLAVKDDSVVNKASKEKVQAAESK